jgi:hypothetical protein
MDTNKEDAVVDRRSLGGARAIVSAIGHVQAVAALMDALARREHLYCWPFLSFRNCGTAIATRS